MKKKYWLLCLLCIGLFKFAQAQDYKTAIGLRFGSPTALSVKHFLTEKSAVEVFGGFRRYSNYGWFNVAGLYQFHNQLGSVDNLKWYWGLGASAYFWSFDFTSDASTTSFGALAALGLEYSFENVPLTIGADWVPAFFLNGYGSGFGAGYGGFAVRYKFR